MLKPEPFKAIRQVPIGNRLLRRRQVEEKTGLSRASIYAAMGAGTFPTPITIGPNRVAWLEAEIDQWIITRIEERNARRRA
jgi:prophage regulatory protein